MYDEVKMRVGLKAKSQAAFRELCNEAQLLEVGNIEKLVDVILFPALRLGCCDAERDNIKKKLVSGSSFENDNVVMNKAVTVRYICYYSS